MISNIDEFEKTVCDKPLQQETAEPSRGYGGHNPDGGDNKVKALEKKARAMLYAAKWESCGEGKRNNAAYGHACQLREFDLSEADAFEILTGWNNGNCPPLPEAEIRKAISNAESYAKRPAGTKLNEPFKPKVQNAPGTWEKIIPFSESDLPGFPIEVLPDELADYLSQVAESLQIPVDMPAMLGLAACSYCVSGCEISPKPDWIEPLNIFTAIIMPPASKKSAALKYITAPLKTHEKEKMEDRSQEVTKNQSERRVLESKQKKLETQLAKGEDIDTRIALNEINQELAEFRDIYLPTVIASDSTPEAVARLLFENDGKLSIFNAEGGIFGTMAGRYNSGTPNLDVFLQGHAGDSLKVNRIGRPTEYIESPCLTIGLAIQPTILENLKHKSFMKECGLLARFLFVTPDCDYGNNKFETKPISEISKTYYQNLIFDLLKTNSITLTLDHEAKKVFAGYFEAVGERLDGDLYQIKFWAGKLRGAVLRIAGILELIKNPHSQEVSENTIHAAIAIGEYLTKHAKAVFDLMDFDQELHLANRILNWIGRKSKTGFSLSEVYTALKTSAANRMEDFKGGLDRLVEHHYLNHIVEKTEGRPSNRYQVNPELFNQT
jgi:hypothetical protein